MAKGRPSKPLNEQQERFCQEYLVDLNGTKAAQRAGYKGGERILASQASRMLKYVNVQERLSQLAQERSKRTQITADRILEELYRIATCDLGLAYDSAGWLKPIHEIPEEVRRAMQGLEVDEIFAGQGDQRSIIGHTKKARFADKNKALELLGKHLKLFTEKHEHSGPDGKPIEHRDVSKLSDEQLNAKIEAMLVKQKSE